MDRILEAGRFALTAVNKQPVHILALFHPDTLEVIKGVTRVNYGVPLIMVVGLGISIGQWNIVRVLENGTVIVKDGTIGSLSSNGIMDVNS